MRGLPVAVRFLTRVPVPWPRDHRDDDLARAVPWFPVVGALLGLVLGGAGLALVAVGLPPGVAAVLVGAVLGPLLTGALHEDGLADTADGLFGGRDRDAALRILRDSRVGAYGVVAVGAALLLRVEALAVLPPASWPAALAVAHALGRLVTVRLLATLSYARAEAPGLAAPMVAGLSPAGQVLALGAGLALAAGLGQRAGLLALAAAVAWSLLLRWWYNRRIGGITGDLLGAACVLVELQALVLLGLAPPGAAAG